MKYLIFIILVVFALQSCNEDNVTAYNIEEGDLSIGESLVDFGSADTIKYLDINIKSGKKIKWMIERNNSNRWIELDIDHSYNSEKVKIKVNRDYLPIGSSIDSIIIVGISAINSDSLSGKPESIKEIRKSIVIQAERNPNYSEILNQIIGNNIFLHQFYVDSTYAFNASFAIEKGTTIKTAFASFYKSKPFADAGAEVIFKGKPFTHPNLQTSLKKRAFSYTVGDIDYSAIYYMPENGFYNPANSNFDDNTLHNFYITGGAEYDSTYQDSILSVSMPYWKNPAFLVSKSSDLIVQWKSTELNDDLVFVVLYSKSDTNVRVVPTVPVLDDNEIITVPKNYIQKLAMAGSEGALWLIRARINKYNKSKRIIHVQAQNHYTFKIN